jgi:hypothetical protein
LIYDYAYDAAGSITSGPIGLYAYSDAAHRHAVTQAGANQYSYDANGAVTARLEAGATYTHAYDLNRPGFCRDSFYWEATNAAAGA